MVNKYIYKYTMSVLIDNKSEVKYSDQERQHYIELAKRSLFLKIQELPYQLVEVDGKTMTGSQYYWTYDRPINMKTPCGDTVTYTNEEVRAVLFALTKKDERSNQIKEEMKQKDPEGSNLIDWGFAHRTLTDEQKNSFETATKKETCFGCKRDFLPDWESIHCKCERWYCKKCWVTFNDECWPDDNNWTRHVKTKREDTGAFYSHWGCDACD